MEHQMHVRQKGEEAQALVQDLFRWQEEQRKKDRVLRDKAMQDKGTSHVRATSDAPSSCQDSAQASSKATAAGHTYDYYRERWDEFDVDAALAAASTVEKQQTSLPTATGSSSAAQQDSADGAPANASPAERISRTRQVKALLPVRKNAPVHLSTVEPSDTPDTWKDEGNNHFKKGDYRRAKECYTASLGLGTTCLAYANRAMAELKLEQFEAAEADCTAALELDTAYVKAYQRRGTARRALGKLLEAAEDFEMALRLEPGTKALAQERASALAALQQAEGLLPPTAKVDIPVTVVSTPSSKSTAAPKPAGVPSKESASLAVAAEESPGVTRSAAGTAGDWLQPAGASAATAEAADEQPVLGALQSAPTEKGDGEKAVQAQPGPASAAATHPTGHLQPVTIHHQAPTQQCRRQQQEEHRSESAEHALEGKSRADAAASMSPELPTQGSAAAFVLPQLDFAAAPKLPSTPKTVAEFEANWKSLRSHAQLRAQYLQLLDPATLPRLFKNMLTAPLLSSIASVILTDVLPGNTAYAMEFLEGLVGVPRFLMTVMSLPRKDKQEMQHLWDGAASSVSDSEFRDRLAAVRAKYGA